jgi:hypothetical protein
MYYKVGEQDEFNMRQTASPVTEMPYPRWAEVRMMKRMLQKILPCLSE